MTYYERTPAYGFPNPHGGKVFAGGSVNWVAGLVPTWNGLVRERGRADPIARGLTINVLDRLGGAVTGPALLGPADSSRVAGGRVLVTWRAAKRHRPAAAVHYRVFWVDARGAGGTTDTGTTSAWLTVHPDASPYRWWVQGRDDWGHVGTSLMRAFAVDATSGTGPDASRDFVRVERTSAGFVFLVGSRARVRGTLDVYDASGRRVRGFQSVFEDGTTRIEWDLCDRDGRALASSTYFLQARIGARSSSRKLVVRR